MKAFDFVVLSLAVVVAAIASAQPFETKTDCVKALPTGKSDELCIKCQSFADCPSGSKWMVVDLRSHSRRIAKAAGVNSVKCRNGSIMDDAGNCVQTFHIPNTTGGTYDDLFKTSTTTSTTTSTSTTQKSVDNIVPSMPLPTIASRLSTTSTTTHNLTKIFDTLDNAEVIKNDTSIAIFLAFFLTPIICFLFYTIFSLPLRPRRLSRQMSHESLTEHSIV